MKFNYLLLALFVCIFTNANIFYKSVELLPLK
jgi:hypothetical protein